MATPGSTLTMVDKRTISKPETLACSKSSRRLLMMRSSQLTMTIRGILNPLLETRLAETWMIGSLPPITSQQSQVRSETKTTLLMSGPSNHLSKLTRSPMRTCNGLSILTERSAPKLSFLLTVINKKKLTLTSLPTQQPRQRVSKRTKNKNWSNSLTQTITF
jgi:hypothetical protein